MGVNNLEPIFCNISVFLSYTNTYTALVKFRKSFTHYLNLYKKNSLVKIKKVPKKVQTSTIIDI